MLLFRRLIPLALMSGMLLGSGPSLGYVVVEAPIVAGPPAVVGPPVVGPSCYNNPYSPYCYPGYSGSVIIGEGYVYGGPHAHFWGNHGDFHGERGFDGYRGHHR